MKRRKRAALNQAGVGPRLVHITVGFDSVRFDGQCRLRPDIAACLKSAKAGSNRASSTPDIFSEFLRNTCVEASPRPELWREHTNAAAIAKFVDLVEQIDDVEP
jgi:hypothetical protein